MAEHDDVLLAGEEVKLAEVRTVSRPGLVSKPKLGSSSGFAGANLAALMPRWPPMALATVNPGLQIPVFIKAGANCSKVHSSLRARSESLGAPTLTAAGASEQRNRCASSDAGRLCDQHVIGSQRIDRDDRSWWPRH